jgi:AP-4 complex subunit mu-1
VGTTRFNVQPAYSLEILDRVAKEVKDFCGLINEEVLRKNFILIYELLDEMFDFGYP